MVFVGAMDWEPNVDAVEYFCGEVWPLVREKIAARTFGSWAGIPAPECKTGFEFGRGHRFGAIGPGPSARSRRRGCALRIGGGTRLKIYEAMAMGKAVVATSVGAEGLDVHDGQDIGLGTSADAFAESVVHYCRIMNSGPVTNVLPLNWRVNMTGPPSERILL